MSSLASRVDGLLADSSTGLNTGLQSFFNSVQDIANDPASQPTRQALLGEADNLVQRFRSLDQQLDGIEDELNLRLKESVNEINQLADAIAEINGEIVISQGRTGQPANDLLDQRDTLVRRLSEHVAVNTVRQSDGSMNVFIGSGQNLVVGMESQHLAVQGSEFDPTRAEIVYAGTNGNTALGTSLTGGAIGGLLDFRAQMLEPTRQSLGETALALTSRFNEQHAAGMDLNGALGGDFFGIDPPSVQASNRNTGSGTAAATVSDVSAVTGVDYVLGYDGASYTLNRADNGQAVAMAGTGTVGDPFVAEGLSITVGGAPAAGDRILIQPTANVAGSISRAITDPQAIAMAAPTRVQADFDNIGNASLSATAVVDRNDPDLLTGAVIEFTGPNTYSIDGAGAFAYVSGEPVVINGSSFSISGTPAAGDRFTLEANSGASGDNRNGLLLEGVQSVGILDGGTTSINENYGQLVASVGSATRQVQVNLDAQSVIRSNAEEAHLANSGVNIDEEAANLLRFQQAYQAAAQVVSVTNTLFDTLINATRR
jgi:flagellar hook-associated protein 1 FlgK